jgi:PKD repeat protein
MKFSTLLLAAVLFGGSTLITAQNTHKVKGKAPKVATVNVLEQSKTAVEKPDAPLFKVPNKEWEERDWDVGEKIIYLDNKKAVINTPSRNRALSPAPDTTFLGIIDNQSSIPPDVMGVAGDDYVMTTLNTQVRVHDKTGAPVMTTGLSSFWASMPDHDRTFDPKITYDPYNHRWIFVTPSHPSLALSKLYIGVSQTSDPTGDWNMYYVNTDPTDITWFDFPTVGFNKKWIVVSGNQFGGDYYRTVFVFNRQEAYEGAEELSYTRFATTQGFTICPAVTYDTTLEQIYLISAASGNSNGYGYIKKFIIDGPVDNPDFRYEGSIGVPDPWNTWAGNSGNFLPQKGSSALLNSVDSRIVNVVYRNGKLWTTHHIFLPAGNPKRCAVQWWELDTTGVIIERGRIDDTSNNYSFAFPSIAVNKFEDIMIGHGVFSENQYASAGYSFRGNYEDTGTIRTYYQYKDGLAPYNKSFGSGRNRWGDYSATCIDPVDQTDFWVIQEYAEQPSSTWSTYWASIRTTYPPEADFVSENTLIPTGESIDFTDLTKGIPSGWEWSFEGGTPDVSNLQNPEQIKFDTDGSYDIRLIASNELGTDTIVKENYITASSTILPDVRFGANRVAVCVGNPVHLIDSSLYMPHSWEWQFTPSTVTFVEGTDAFSQNPVVVFNESGLYTVTLSATNLNGTSSETKFDFITAGGFVPYFHENFENGLDNQYWETDNPDNRLTWEVSETGGYYSDRAAFMDFTEYIYYGERDRLISPPFNLEGMSNAVLEFKHAYATRFDGATDSLIVLLSDDCGTTWERMAAYGDDGTGSFATAAKYDGDDLWIPQVNTDWCGLGYGSDCYSINLNNYTGKSNVLVAFESFNSFGNPLYIDDVTISQFVGIEKKPENDSFTIYPNPATGHLTIEMNRDHAFSGLVISNQLGQTVYMQHNLKDNVINLSTEGWTKGVYFVRLEGNTGTKTRKVVVY